MVLTFLGLPLKNSWLFPAIQSVHLVGLAILVGTIVIVDLRLLDLRLLDLRLLGYGLRRHSVSRLASELSPWTRIGLIVMFATGPLLFFSDVTRYSSNPAFRVKMAILAVALVFHFAIHRNIVAPENGFRISVLDKAAALISMALWTSVVIAARAIADFDI